MFEHVPEELKALRQWVNWTVKPLENGKTTKVPMHWHRGQWFPASSTNPDTWRSFEEVVAADPEHIGFVFTAGDLYVGIDLDHMVVDGLLTDEAVSIITHFSGTYAETSPSGEGLHIYCRGVLPANAWHKQTLPDGSAIEIYDSARYFTVTGDALQAAAFLPAADCQVGIDWLLAHYQPSHGVGEATAEVEVDTELDITLDPDANPPWKKFSALRAKYREEKDRWQATWDKTRKMPKDQSDSSYEQSLCDMMAEANWTPQEMADTLMAFRAEHGGKPKHSRYYRATIIKAIAYAARKQALSDLPSADSADPDEVRALISHLTGLDVVRYVQTGKYDGIYRVYLSDGEPALVGKAEEARSQARWQNLAQDKNGVPFEALTKPQWQQFLVCLGRIVEREDTDESTLIAEYTAYLRAYTRSAPATVDADELSNGTPFCVDGVVHINSASCAHWLKSQRIHTSDVLLRSILRMLGAESTLVHRRGRNNDVVKRYWKLTLPLDVAVAP